MNFFEEMYQDKNNPKKTSLFLEDFLLFAMYSPVILRLAHSRWEELPDYVKDSVNPEIQELIQKADTFSSAELQKKINAHTITRAINVLLGYKKCPIPLTQDKTIPTEQKNLLSHRGEWALKRLLHAACHGEWTEGMTELALQTSHKFLMKLDYYKRPHITPKGADVLTLVYPKDNTICFDFPVLQLSQGCLNHCSHCFCDAQNHLSFMPYPVWRAWYEGLNNYYKYYEGICWEQEITQKKFGFKIKKWKKHIYPHTFARFFHDSDPSQYYDSIMGVDGGDVALFVTMQGGDYYFLTKGVTNRLSRRAIAKAAMATKIDLSFVDTPKEDMRHNIRQAKETLDLIHSVPLNHGVERLAHTHLKTPSVSAEKIFPGENIGHQDIVPSGRANQFPDSELNHDKPVDIYPFTINPNGDLVLPYCRYGQYTQEKLKNVFGFQVKLDVSVLKDKIALWKKQKKSY